MSGTLRNTSALYGGLPNNTSQQILPVNVRDVVASALIVFPVQQPAAGSTSATATILTDPFNVINSQTGGGTGVVATAGYTKVWNALAVPINVYPPATNAQFENFGNNIPVSIAPGASADFAMITATQGYVR